jgi:hypothetical protein
MRRGPKSTTLRPAAAVTTRVAFGGKDRLQVHLVHEESLGELGLRDRRADLEDRLVLEHRRALGHGIDVAGEAEALQPAQEALAERAERGEVVEVRAGEAQALEVAEHVVEAAGEEVVAPLGQAAHEETEGGGLLHAALDIGLQDGELVEIGEQAEVGVVYPALRRRHRHLLQRAGPRRTERLRTWPRLARRFVPRAGRRAQSAFGNRRKRRPRRSRHTRRRSRGLV